MKIENGYIVVSGCDISFSELHQIIRQIDNKVVSFYEKGNTEMVRLQDGEMSVHDYLKSTDLELLDQIEESFLPPPTDHSDYKMIIFDQTTKRNLVA